MSRTTFVMVVDDDPDDIELLCEALLKVQPHLQIATCQSGIQCIERLQAMADSEIPSLLVLDYNMSDIDGAEVLKRISNSKRYEAVTKIMWSTSNSKQYQEACAANGAHYYFKKPSTFPEVIEMAEKMLTVSFSGEKK